MLYGIEWRPQYSEFDFSIKNPSLYEYDNFDIDVSTDLMIDELKQKDANIASCVTAPLNEPPRVIIQNLSNTSAPAAIGRFGEGDKEYRIRCDKLPSDSQIDFFAATSNPGAPRQAVKWFALKGSFQTSGRNRDVRIFQCNMGEHCPRVR